MQVFILERGYDYESSSILGVYDDFDNLVDAFHKYCNESVYTEESGEHICLNADYFVVSIHHLNGDGRHFSYIYADDIEEEFNIRKYSVDGFDGFDRAYIEGVLNNGRA